MENVRNRRQREAKPPGKDAVYDGAFSGHLAPIRVHGAPEFVVMMDAAAKRRGVNRSSWIRRTLAVGIAHDLGINIRSVLHWSPAIGPYGKQIQWQRGGRDDGTGIEQWCPHPGCTGDHL